jgi:hypothetical protein
MGTTTMSITWSVLVHAAQMRERRPRRKAAMASTGAEGVCDVLWKLVKVGRDADAAAPDAAAQEAVVGVRRGACGRGRGRILRLALTVLVDWPLVLWHLQHSDSYGARFCQGSLPWGVTRPIRARLGGGSRIGPCAAD